MDQYTYPSGFRAGEKVMYRNREGFRKKYNNHIHIPDGPVTVLVPPQEESWPADAVQIDTGKDGQGAVDAELLNRVDLSLHAPEEFPIPPAAMVLNEGEGVHDVLIRMIEERKRKGLEIYGKTLRPFNGRNAALDLLEEDIDRVAYSTQLALEWDRLVQRANAQEAALALNEIRIRKQETPEFLCEVPFRQAMQDVLRAKELRRLALMPITEECVYALGFEGWNPWFGLASPVYAHPKMSGVELYQRDEARASMMAPLVTQWYARMGNCSKRKAIPLANQKQLYLLCEMFGAV